MSERLERIEAELAHMEHLCEQLNQVVVEQGKALARLNTQVQRLARTVESQELDRIKSTNPKPPHYGGA